MKASTRVIRKGSEIEYYCYTYMSPCPQSEFEMVDNIYDLKIDYRWRLAIRSLLADYIRAEKQRSPTAPLKRPCTSSSDQCFHVLHNIEYDRTIFRPKKHET